MFVPEHVLNDKMRETNFLLLCDDRCREDQRVQLVAYSHYGAMYADKSRIARAVLLAQIAALEAYDRTLEQCGIVLRKS